MSRIKYQNRHGVQFVDCTAFVDGGGIDSDLVRWEDGETREVDDNRKVRFRLHSQPDAPVRTVRAVDAIYDMGPNFVDAETGFNPDYVCADTGEEALAIHFHDHNSPNVINYRTEDGRPLTVKAFLIRNPQYLAQHIRDGMPFGLQEEIRDGIRAKGEEPPAPPEPEPQPEAAPALNDEPAEIKE